MNQSTVASSPWIVIVLMLLILYFLIIRPQQKREKQAADMRRSVDVGDSITTIGGIVGRVIDVKDDDIVVIEVGAARTKLHFKRWAIQSKDTLEVAEKAKTAKNAPPEKTDEQKQ